MNLFVKEPMSCRKEKNRKKGEKGIRPGTRGRARLGGRHRSSGRGRCTLMMSHEHRV